MNLPRFDRDGSVAPGRLFRPGLVFPANRLGAWNLGPAPQPRRFQSWRVCCPRCGLLGLALVRQAGSQS